MTDRALAPRAPGSKHFPPLDAAPILKHYNKNLGTLAPEYMLPSQIDDRGVVDIFATVEQALSLIDANYIFPKEHCDEHHFVWERAWYMPLNFGGDSTPSKYREIPFHKGYLPRQLHNFIHVAVAPPPIPDMEVMRSRVEAYELAKKLFGAARSAVQFERGVMQSPAGRNRSSRLRNIDTEVMEEILLSMHDRFQDELSRAPEATEFVDIRLLRGRSIEEAARHLGRAAARSSMNLLPIVFANRAA